MTAKLFAFPWCTKVMALLCVWIGFVEQAHSENNTPQQTRVYIGSLAGEHIVLTFSTLVSENDGVLPAEEASKIRARYFYRKFGKVIPIVEQPNGLLAECVESFHDLDCSKPSGYWSFALQQEPTETSFSAKWRATPVATTQPVTLTLANVESSTNDNTWNELLGRGPTKLVGIKAMHGVSAAMLVDIRSGAKVPQLISGYTDEVMQSFNASQLSQLQIKAANSLRLSSVGGEDESMTSIQFVSPKWLTIGGGAGGYYGGAHPLFAYDSRTFNVATTKPVDERSIFFRYFSDEDVERLSEAKVGSSKIEARFSNVSVPLRELKRKGTIEGLVVAEINKLLNGSIRNNAWYERCKEASSWLEGDELTELVFTRDELIRSSQPYFPGFQLMPTQKGLAIYTNDTPEVTRGCRGVMFTIPWKKVQPYLKENLVD
jgi:hypothetical protein